MHGHHAGWRSTWRWGENLPNAHFVCCIIASRARSDSAPWRDMAYVEVPDTAALRPDAWRELGALQLYDEEGFDAFSRLAMHARMQHWPHSAEPVLQELSYNEAQHAQVSACQHTARA